MKSRTVFARRGAAVLAAGALGLAGLAGPAASAAQPLNGQVRVIKAAKHDSTAPLRDLHWQLPEVVQRIVTDHKMGRAELQRLQLKLARGGYLGEREDHEAEPVRRKQPARKTPLTVRDKVRQVAALHRRAAPAPVITPVANFDGVSNQWGVYPPDPNMAAGENYVTELVNSGFSVYDKSGNLVLGPVDTNTLWLGFGGPCENDNNGDGVVLYDQMAHRWIISQFAVSSSPYYECVAISETGDPTGAYYRYAFKISDSLFPDYPKLGLWTDGYYATFNDFAGNSFAGVTLAAFDRDAMLAGKDADMVQFFLDASQTLGAYSVLPADLDGDTPPPTGAPEKFASYVSPNLWGISSYGLTMWRMHVDWQTPSKSTLSGPSGIQVPAFNDGVCGFSRSCIPQPNGAPGLDAISDRLLFRLAYRNLGTHEAMVVNQTVSVGSNNNPPAGVRWYELDTSSPGAGDWSLGQSGTFAPSDGNSRWMGSVAMDHRGDMFLGYSLSSSSVAPSITYTGRLAGDPAGQMTLPEQTLHAGSGEQTGTANRWGDYTSAVIDPSNDCTFWYVNEYYPKTSTVGWATRIGAMRFTACTGITTGTLTGTVTSSADGSPVAGARVMVDPGNIVVKTDKSGKYQVTLAPGSYTVTAKAYPYSTSSGTGVSVSGGQSTSQDISLTPVPKVTVSGKITDGGTPAGKHGWGLYAHVAVSVSPFGQVARVHTDPSTGAYSMKVARGFKYTMQVSPAAGVYDGSYDPASVTFAPSAATTKNMALNVNAACTAPGYSRSYGASFEGSKFPPAGWSVTNAVNGSPVVWQTNAAWQEGNYTGGAGTAAAADSNLAYPYTGTYDTALVTPPIRVSDLGSDLTLHFLLNYQQYQASALDVDISLDGGKTWTTMQHITSGQGAVYGLPGAKDQVDLAKYVPAGTKTFQLRWRYYDLSAGWDYYAQVDDIGIGQCRPMPGGLVVGQVTDADSGKGASGIMVIDDLGNSAETELTSDDPNLQDLYTLFTKAGRRTLTASSSASSFVSSAEDVTADQAARDDMALGNADLAVTEVTPTTLDRDSLGRAATVTVSNNGPDAAAGVQLSTTATSFVRLESATPSQGSCMLQSRSLKCDLGDIPAGGSVTVDVKGFGTYAGQATVTSSASETDNDPDTSNNASSGQVKVSTPSSGAAAQDSGGGGALGWLPVTVLAALALGAALRRRRVL